VRRDRGAVLSRPRCPGRRTPPGGVEARSPYHRARGPRMSISPAEIRHVRLRRRLFGLKKKDVERELDRIAESFGEVWRQRQDLEERNHEIAVELARHQEDEARVRQT